jgi:hypothetical protein
MPNKKQIVTRIIHNVANDGDEAIFQTWDPKKGLMDKVFYKHDACWRLEVRGPIANQDQKTGQLFIDTERALCSIPAFRQEISRIQEQLKQSDFNLGQISSHIASNWKIVNGANWVAWLIQNWDPTNQQHPPLNGSNSPESFCPWTIELNYMREISTRQEVCRSVTITLNAGVSSRDATAVAELAQKALDSSMVRKGRPGLTDIEKQMLLKEFDKRGLPKSRKREQMVRNVQKKFPQFKATVIRGELQRWLIDKKQKIRRYKVLQH